MSTSPSPIYTPPPRPARTIRTRKRSMSASAASRRIANMTVDWLGPRTTKAFRAAGLLDESAPLADHQRGGSVDSRYTASPNRFGSVSSYRSASRMSLSESPRSASTAPSSFIWGAGSRDTKDEDAAKHAMEMSALLGALSDSQRTARILQEQNNELREQFQIREEELLGVIRQLENARRYEEEERGGELEEENAVLRGVADDLRREIGDMLRKKPSSVFLAPPANMAMLVREEPIVGRMRKTAHTLSGDRLNRMMSDDSQVSLALTPEHAMLLDDMDATSLYEGSLADR